MHGNPTLILYLNMKSDSAKETNCQLAEIDEVHVLSQQTIEAA